MEIIGRLNRECGFELELKITANQLPVQSDPDSELIQAIISVVNEMPELSPQNLLKSMGEVIGVDLTVYPQAKQLGEFAPMTVAGTTDAAQLMKDRVDIQLAVYGPGMPMLNHKVDERIPLKQYTDFIEAYIRIIERYMK